MALDMKQVKAVQEATGHSVFGSSSLPRIVSCPASVGMELKAGLKPASIYAAKGTELHQVTERALRRENPSAYLHTLVDLTVEDTCYVLDAIEYVYRIIAKHPGGLVVPQPISPGKYDMEEVRKHIEAGNVVMLLEVEGSLASYGIPECYGTSDVGLLSMHRTDIIDHKFGHGVAVYATENHQLIGYAGMAIPFTEDPDPDHEIYVHINQPTKNIFDEWKVPWDTLNQMILGDIADAIEEAKGENPSFGPSTKACRFCNANMGCRERHKSLVGNAQLIQNMAKNPTHVSNEKWAVFLEAAESIKTAISQVEKHALSEIQKGNDFPGFKAVRGRSNRAFIDKEQGQAYMAKRLGKRAMKEPDYITLTQAEKLDKSLKDDDQWKALIHKPDGALKLVKASDPGTAVEFGVKGIMNQIARGEV